VSLGDFEGEILPWLRDSTVKQLIILSGAFNINAAQHLSLHI
jgi:hypothetical protein